MGYLPGTMDAQTDAPSSRRPHRRAAPREITAGRTITVRVRFADLRSVTRSLTLSAPISATRALAEIAEDLVRGVLADHRNEKTISLLAIAVSNLEAHAIVQLELPLGLPTKDAVPARRRAWRDRAQTAPRCDPQALRRRSGGLWVSRAGWPLRPDEFRRLAEREL